MASSLMIVTLVDNGLLKYIIWGDVNMSLVGEDILKDLPIGQTGIEGGRDG